VLGRRSEPRGPEENQINLDSKSPQHSTRNQSNHRFARLFRLRIFAKYRRTAGPACPPHPYPSPPEGGVGARGRQRPRFTNPSELDGRYCPVPSPTLLDFRKIQGSPRIHAPIRANRRAGLANLLGVFRQEMLTPRSVMPAKTRGGGRKIVPDRAVSLLKWRINSQSLGAIAE
jgi:hypothetical protein